MLEKRDLIKGSIDSLLLCLIQQEPTYGYKIIKELDRQSQGYFKFKEGTLYPALHRLEETGLIAGEWHSLDNCRQRRYYRITEKGLDRLTDKQSQWQDFLAAMNSIMRPVAD
jgi:PadR family transcriptional regulator, regulatory protein PadR